LLKLSAVKIGRFFPTENKALPADFQVDPRLRPEVGDLLVTRSNTPAYVGDACAIVERPGQVVLCDLIYRLRLDSRILPEYAAAALLRTAGRAHLTSAARGSSQSMVKLRGEDVKAARVPLVNPGKQGEIVAAFRKARLDVDQVQAALNNQLRVLAEHRDALITAAVTGEFEVSGVGA